MILAYIIFFGIPAAFSLALAIYIVCSKGWSALSFRAATLFVVSLFLGPYVAYCYRLQYLWFFKWCYWSTIKHVNLFLLNIVDWLMYR